ncbi:MAG: hypothetical protein LBL61_05980 [Elusimicrobiota bacterium]|jgi:hypothetical protein|nr:hypothetical protein [Elusimicrobiota bacterium]
MKKLLLVLIFLSGFYGGAFAAVGCDLNDPDRDVKRFFPESTGYKTAYMSLDRLGGQELLQQVETRLGDKFTGLYETIDVPYTVYTIFKDKEIIGYIHGINQKGKYGGLQVFLIYDTKGTITNFYYQKLTNKEAKKMRSPAFGAQFKGLSFGDFKNYDPLSHTGMPKVIKGEGDDFFSTLRAVKKNLILMDIFVFNNKGTVK